MKKIILAALTILSFGAAAASAQSLCHAMPPQTHTGNQ
jgi:hypothetical protein